MAINAHESTKKYYFAFCYLSNLSPKTMYYNNIKHFFSTLKYNLKNFLLKFLKLKSIGSGISNKAWLGREMCFVVVVVVVVVANIV